jgi:cleavage and polyadenylation specificity factor subunit 1
MNEWEHVTCMKTIALRFQGNLMKTYIAIGTANCFNEDVVSRGRVILFDIIEVVPEVNQPLTKHKLKVNRFFKFHYLLFGFRSFMIAKKKVL